MNNFFTETCLIVPGFVFETSWAFSMRHTQGGINLAGWSQGAPIYRPSLTSPQHEISADSKKTSHSVYYAGFHESVPISVQML